MYRLIFDQLNRHDKEKWNREVTAFMKHASEGCCIRVSSNTYASGSLRNIRPVTVVKVKDIEKKGFFARRPVNLTVEFPGGVTAKVFTTLFGLIIVSAEFLTRLGLKESELELGIYEQKDALQLEEDLRRYRLN